MSGIVKCKACGVDCTIGEGGWNVPYCSEKCYATAPTIARLTADLAEARRELEAVKAERDQAREQRAVMLDQHDRLCAPAISRQAAAERIVEAARECAEHIMLNTCRPNDLHHYQNEIIAHRAAKALLKDIATYDTAKGKEG